MAEKNDNIKKWDPALKRFTKDYNKSIKYLWAGQTISQIGDSLYEIGLLWLMLEVTGSKTLTGLVAMSAYLPTLLFGLVAGAFVDHFDRRKIMIWADILRMFVVLFIPVAYYFFSLNAILLGAITFVVALLATFFNPARDAIIPQLVKPDEIFKTNSLMQTTWQFSLLAGPAIAGLVLALVGIINLFTVDALTFLISLLFITAIGRRYKTKETEKKSLGDGLSLGWQNIKEGVKYAAGNPVIRILLFFTAIDNIFIMGPAIVGLAIFVKEFLNAPAYVFAGAQTAMAAGMLTGTFLLNRYGKGLRLNMVLLTGIILDGLTYFPLLYVTTAWQLWLALFIHGLVIPMIIIPRPTIIHTMVPQEYHGRIFAMISMAVVGLTAISAALTGIISEWVPINEIFGWIAILAALTGATGAFSKEFRKAF